MCVINDAIFDIISMNIVIDFDVLLAILKYTQLDGFRRGEYFEHGLPAPCTTVLFHTAPTYGVGGTETAMQRSWAEFFSSMEEGLN